ncbi:uncharacterized protein N7500_003433 [Penicillium coprophilum]|uniref:uncharacterized protein n=1 Tax=Penicillium coprophilum TaxID=36646 RepID=UPI002383BEF2|nr:uncharacterized protein N7500_003433 [Penicillium coprophilum]KAJ5170650.1 hypothetical protein N7500_003433 [Penicillium coprophilum]
MVKGRFYNLEITSLAREAIYFYYFFAYEGGTYLTLRFDKICEENKLFCGVKTINHINKLDFLKAYPFTQIKAFKSETIKNSFRVASLIPFIPNRVISKLNIRLRTPTPPSRGSD